MTRVVMVVVLLAGVLGALLWITAPDAFQADFRTLNRSSIATLDPAAMSWDHDIRMGLTVWEGLCRYDPATTEAIPGSALPPTISEDRRTYTFRIRPEARWHNGDPVTAEDFVYGWRRSCEPGTAADYAFFFDLIDGVAAYRSWRLAEAERISTIDDTTAKRTARDSHLAAADERFQKTVGIHALDTATLEVRLVRPVPYFLDLCAFPTFMPVHVGRTDPFRIISDDGLIYYNEQWVKPDNALFNGAFYITDWKFKRHVRLKKNPYYWDRDSVKLNTIEVVDADDPNTAWLLYSGGQVDWLDHLDTSFAPRLFAASGSPFPNALNRTGTERQDIHIWPAFGTYFYNFNCTDHLPGGRPNPYLDKRVRQAFTMAVDKQSLIDQVVRQGNPVSTTLVPVGTIPGYPTVTGLPYDPAKARALMAEAGYPNGKGFPEVIVEFNTGFTHGDIAQAIVKMWEANLGVVARVEGKEIKTFHEDRKNQNYVIARGSWYGDYQDPTTFLDMFTTGNGNNDSGYSDPAYDRMIVEAEEARDPKERLARLADAERYLVNEGLPILPIYQYVNTFAFDPDRIKNLYLTPRRMTMLRVVEVVK